MSAIKSSIPGVGGSPPTTAPHSLLPVSAIAQKVLPNSDSPIKPLTGSGLSYVTLQPANQPLSLVHEHRQSVYQTPPYHGSQEKELEERPLPNGLEIQKLDGAQKTDEESGKIEANRNNNLSPDNNSCEEVKRVEVEVEEEEEEEVVEAAPKVSTEFPALCASTPKVEEKKTPVNNGSKEPEGMAVSPTALQNKLLTHKDEPPLKTEVQKAKTQTSKQGSEPVVSSATVTPKPETKITVTGSPKANKRKSRELKDLKGGSSIADGASKPKRNRTQTQPYQSPLPEIALLVKSLNKSPATKAADDKLIVFYKNEFLAVRNAEGSFYVCQAMQNIYKSSRRIRIRWLSQDKNNGEIYSPDFYDFIDFDCILTNLNLNKIDKNKFQLTKIELLRTENILKRAIDVEAGVSEKPRVTEEHPDGLDLSLYKDESQLKKRRKAPTLGGGKKQSSSPRKKMKRSSSSGPSDDETLSEDEIGEQKKTKPSRPKDERKSKRMSKNLIKTLAIVKSVGKGSSSRAERALNRNKGPDGKEDASEESNNANIAGTTTISVAAEGKAEGKKPGEKRGKDNVVSRTKLRGSAQQGTISAPPSSTTPTTTTTTSSSANNTTAGRPKRVSATILSSEESTTRKKPRGRA